MTYDEPYSTSSSEGECIALIDSPPSESKTTEVVDEVQLGSENPVSQCTSVELYEVVPLKDDYLHDYMFVGSYDENEDNEGSDTSSRYYNALAEDIGAELGWHHNLVFSGGEPKLAQEVAQIRLETCITLSFDLGASLAPVSEEAGSSQCLKEHLLACGTSSPMSAYIYYIGFLEHVFHATARILGRLQEESGSAHGALKLWPGEIADPRSRRDLQRKIVRAHANAVREDLQEFPELAFRDPDVDVAENLAFQAFRRLSTVLPLYLQQSRRRTIPTVLFVFQGIDALATSTFGDGTRDLLQPHTPTTRLRPYTLLDLLFVALRLFSEDGLRAIFHFRETDVLEGILRDSLDTPVPTQSWRPRRNRWPPLSSRAYSSAIKAQRLGKESPSSVSDPVDEDLFGPIYATPASPSDTPPPMSQTSSEATSSQPPSTPSSAIASPIVSRTQRSASLRRDCGPNDYDSPRATKRFKVDVMSSTVPRLTRRMRVHHCDSSRPRSWNSLRRTSIAQESASSSYCSSTPSLRSWPWEKEKLHTVAAASWDNTDQEPKVGTTAEVLSLGINT